MVPSTLDKEALQAIVNNGSKRLTYLKEQRRKAYREPVPPAELLATLAEIDELNEKVRQATSALVHHNVALRLQASLQ